MSLAPPHEADAHKAEAEQAERCRLGDPRGWWCCSCELEGYVANTAVYRGTANARYLPQGVRA